MTDHSGPALLSPREALETLTVVGLIGPEPSAKTMLGISDKQARRKVKAGEIPVIKYGVRYMVPTAWLRRVLETGWPEPSEQEEPQPEPKPAKVRRPKVDLSKAWRLVETDHGYEFVDADSAQ